MTAISVIVPARDAAATLGACLEALAGQEADGGFEVIVVDDGSRDGTASLARGAGVTVLEQQGAGPAAARNRGVEASSGAALAFCDADCVPQPGWLAAGLRALRHSTLVQGRVTPDPTAELGPYDRTLWVSAEVGLWETANLFVTREAFDRVGGFEDWLTPRVGKAMAEDVWFGWRVRRAGEPSAFAPDALVHHAVFARGPVAYVDERRRLEHFPELVSRMPELRETLCHGRWFLNRRSAAFDLAVAGLVAAALRRAWWPLALALPWMRLGWLRARPFGRRAPEVLAVDAAADAVGFAALLAGSVRSRTPLL